MDWETLVQNIQTSFTMSKISSEKGEVLIPAEPLDLPKALGDITENDDEIGHIEWVGAGEVLEEEFPTCGLMDFHWEGFGPTSWFACLAMADLGAMGALVYQVTDIPTSKAFALVRPRDRTAVWSAFFLDLLSDNGKSYGIDVFGGLPSRTVNWQADLLPSFVVKEAYRRWLEWQSPGGAGRGWSKLRDYTIGRLEQPNPLARSTALLEKLARLGPEGYLEATKADAVELSETDRSIILDNYFELTYSE